MNENKDSEKDNEKEKKNKLSKRLAIINTVAMTFFLVTASFFLIAAERPDYSDTERRRLASMPDFDTDTYFSGEYIKDVMEFYNDTVPFRDNFKALSAKFRGLFGISFNNAEFYFDDPIAETLPPVAETTSVAVPDTDIISETEPAVSSAPETTTAGTTQAETADNKEAELEVSNNIFVLYVDGHWRAMPRFMGGNETAYADSLNNYKKELGGINIYSMIIPTQEEFYLPEKYSGYVSSHFDAIENLSEKLDNVVAVDAYSVLQEHKDEDIYSRTDHHWLPLGAYYAAEQFAKTADTEFSDISDYERVDIEGYLGTLYGQTESPKLLGDPEIFTYYKPQNDYTSYYYTTDYVFEYTFPLFVGQPVSQSYSIFMGGDSKIVRIETDVKNGRKLAVWKDSYGNALIPFLTGSFEEIYVLDIRYFKLNAVDFMKERGITDILFTMCTFTAADTAKVKFLEENRLR